jgi:hypothetical protein
MNNTFSRFTSSAIALPLLVTLFASLLGSQLVAFAQTPALGTPTLQTPSVRCVNGLPQVTLSWTSATGAASYMVQRRLEPNQGWNGPALQDSIPGTTYVDNHWASTFGVMTYYYQLAAVKGDDEARAYSNEVSIAVPNCRTIGNSSGTIVALPQPTTQPAPTAPVVQAVPTPLPVSTTVNINAPKLEVPTMRCVNGLPEVTLKWNTIDGAQTYMIQRRLSPNLGWSGPALDSGLKTTTYVDKKWASSFGVMTYYYQVAAANTTSRTYSNEVALAVPNCRTIGNSASTAAVASAGTTQTPPQTPAPLPVVTAPSAAPAPTPAPTPSGKMLWGVDLPYGGMSLDSFESMVGKEANMQMIFSHWGNDPQFPSHYGPTLRDQGKTMVLFWEAVDYNRDYSSQPEYSYDAVLRGDLDNFFRNFAAGAKAYGGPVIIVPFSEFNGSWFPWGMNVGNNTPQKLAAAFRHIRPFFNNAPNVKFAWVPNAEANRNDNLAAAYPGDAYVDYVGVDGFNFGGGEEMTFNQLFGGTLNHLKQFNKPAMVFSMGTHEGSGKAAWITDAITVQIPKYPQVKGWLWFNENKETDWRVESDAASLAAFKKALP